jgi:hypothetical protein
MGSRSVLAVFVFTLSACVSSGNDVSTVLPPAADATTYSSSETAPFYVDFRTRPYFTITHTFLEYGAQDSSGRPLERKTVGFFPQGGALGLFIGIVAFAGEVNSEDYYTNLPASATFHRNLTAEQYERLTRGIIV